jgi:hypothetical protein
VTACWTYASESNAYYYQLGTAHDEMAVNLGAGDGTFPTGVVLIPSSNDIRALGRIAADDFNGDGIPDLIVTDMPVTNSPVLKLFTGKGTAASIPHQQPADGRHHLNGSQRLQPRRARRHGRYSDWTKHVLVLIGKGDGTFLSPVSYATGNTPTLATALQSRGNDVTDLAVLNSDDNTLGILLGNGDGDRTESRCQPFLVVMVILATLESLAWRIGRSGYSVGHP